MKSLTIESPTTEQIKKARLEAGLTQKKAAAKIFSKSYRSWQNYESGVNDMHPAIWWCFLQRTKGLRANKSPK